MFLSALFNATATFFYMTMIVKLSKADSLYGIGLICLASFLGTYATGLLVNKLEKDDLWIFDIYPTDNESGKVFADMVRESELAIVTYKGFNENKEQVLCSKVYSQDKKQSRLIESLIPAEFKYSVVEVKQSKIM